MVFNWDQSKHIVANGEVFFLMSNAMTFPFSLLIDYIV